MSFCCILVFDIKKTEEKNPKSSPTETPQMWMPSFFCTNPLPSIPQKNSEMENLHPQNKLNKIMSNVKDSPFQPPLDSLDETPTTFLKLKTHQDASVSPP